MAFRVISSLAALAIVSMTLAACQESDIPKDIRPVPYRLTQRMQEQGMRETAPVLIRIFKEESALEIWKEKKDGTFGLLKTYSICKWSGQLGPKIKEGDRQAPEGFYTITPAQMNPDSKYYLSFNIGYPNDFDQALGRTGSNIMVHGACSSSGCYSMTDADSGELFALARDAFRGGQTKFQIEAFPFRMSAENMARHRDNPNLPFWKMLKVGYDHFEVSHRVPKVDVCNKSYVFDADAGNAAFRPTAACPPYKLPEALASAVAAKRAADEVKYTAAVTKFEADEGRAIANAVRDGEKKPKASLFSIWNRPKGQPAETAAIPLPTPSPKSANGPVSPGFDSAVEVATVPIPRGKPRLDVNGVPVVKVSAVEKAMAPEKKPKAEKVAVDEAIKVEPLKPAKATLPAKPVQVAKAAPAPVAAPASTSVAAATPGPAGSRQVGTLVKRPFLWPDDEADPKAQSAD